jgi:hypothetical protein
MMNEQVDERLWRLAKKRANFKKSLLTYMLVNLFLWAIWWITSGNETGFRGWFIAWPIWVTLGWGLGIAFQYFDAYGDGDRQTSVEKEYERLRQQQRG